MRDFNNNGDMIVEGDVNINDNSQNEYKPLAECNNEELIAERLFRLENIKIEQRKKVKRLRPFYFLTIILFFSAAIWAMYNGKPDLIAIFMGGVSAFLGYQSLIATVDQNPFQKEEQEIVNWISKTLKQRRAE